MAMRTQVEGKVLFRTVMIKQLQTPIWWVRDQQKNGFAMDTANFDAVAMNQVSKMKSLPR
jgi:hypothetical protein